MNAKPLLTAMTVALLAAGCASVSTPPSALVEARSTVRTAETNPDVLASAPLELKKATDSLARANMALANRDPEVEVNHHAYMATQRARTAIAVGTAKAGEDLIRTAEVERERVRSEAREIEAQRARSAAVAANADARAARADADVQRNQTAVAQQQAFAAQQQASTAQREASTAAEQAVAAQALAASAVARSEILERQLAALEANKTERGLVITLGDVLFEFNRAEVKSTAQARLAHLANFLREYPDRRVSVEGHTDSIGSASYNAELSQRRAEAIKSQLVGLGVSPDRITTTGYGKEFPVAANDTDTNRAINRRVEVVIFEAGQPVRLRR